MGFGEILMRFVVKVGDVVALARRFREDPSTAMGELATTVRQLVTETVERVMEAEIELHLAEEKDPASKRNGFRTRSFGIKGVGEVNVRVPRDRKGTYESRVVPPGRRYDEATERDLAALHLAGISTRMLGMLSSRVLGVKVSAQEVSNAMKTLVPAARAFLERPLGDRRWRYLYIDGTNFRVRRTTVDLEPTLVVLGVDEGGFKSVPAMVQGDRDSRAAWEMVFSELKRRGLDASAVELGIMDGLPGLADAFREAFPKARVARCWVHKARNVMPRVARRYQAEFQADWDRVQYAEDLGSARTNFEALRGRWQKPCEDAVASMERDLAELLVHYEFPKEHWDALRTTNPIGWIKSSHRSEGETIGRAILKL